MLFSFLLFRSDANINVICVLKPSLILPVASVYKHGVVERALFPLLFTQDRRPYSRRWPRGGAICLWTGAMIFACDMSKQNVVSPTRSIDRGERVVPAGGPCRQGYISQGGINDTYSKTSDQARQRVCVFLKLHRAALCVYVYVYVCICGMSIDTAQSGPIILVILCHSY